jgi:large subunit ribosomal protein L3
VPPPTQCGARVEPWRARPVPFWRHGFGGGPNTHGNTKHRKPGSVGPGTDPSRVIKGKKMPGHYGDHKHTTIRLRVEQIDAERNLIYIRGAVAGPTNGIVIVKKQA